MATTDPTAPLHDAPIPPELPALVLATTVVFPFDVVSVQVGRPHDLRLLDANPGDDVIVACFFPRAPDGEDADSKDEVFPVGVACRVIHRMRMPNETMQVVFQGLRRVEWGESLGREPWLRVRVQPVEPREPRGADVDGLVYRCMEMVDELVRSDGSYPREMVDILRMNIAGGGRFADLVGAHVSFPLPVKRRIASTADVRDRLRVLEEVLEEAIGRVRVEADVTQRVKVDLEQRQREGLLRAQMRAIKKELGEEPGDEDVTDLRERVRAAGLPPDAEAAAVRELDRMAGMSSSSAEYHVSRTYVQWFLDLPWHATSKARLDLERARAVLDRDHFGLEDVKERILEFLAVRRLRKDPRGPLLCLVGPPGVGKTSLGRSIAEAVGRPFVRVSVGGMRDEAEIKGHRRTYVGALPGKVLQALKRAGTRDPVFMVDEIDKMGHDPARGDPSAAMLEVLDPEQNATFSDHYLDVPFDLSRVFFVATANVLDEIPGPLRDRMEVISLAGYTREEKAHIARRHLWPKVVADHGLKDAQVTVTDEALKAVADGWTREAGVRNLERLLGRIVRKVARAVAGGRTEPVRVDVGDLETYLDAKPYVDEGRAREPAVGVATGLAWTAGGGTVLFIETLSMPGSGRIHLTGRLGEVMKESADLAYSWVRANAEDLGIDPGAFERHDVHVHVPEGAVPKDGPSAGVTLVTALVSLFTERPVRTDLAMTGEVTLRGRVLPVGGVKEKVLAAYRAGIRTVLLPEGNRRDLKDVPEEVREAVDLQFTADVRRNLDAALMSVLVPGARERRALGPRATPPGALPPPP
ncbi:MAG: endopeptidase La [Planctomycetes bacterium]|nr:endopeptidase La [Planctomycetota bacterium]